ncbi:MAG: hypothetical protein QOH56_2518 [Pseudonocardiales bacterium]|jgi:hypothetical protein|nr:hypothetical protein [Pseudonocardiales bacterium]
MSGQTSRELANPSGPEPTSTSPPPHEAARALDLLRRGGATEGELRLLRSHGDVLTALGRTHEAAQAWHRFLSLASSPDRVRETNAFDDNTDGTVTIDRVKAKLAQLITEHGTRPG